MKSIDLAALASITGGRAFAQPGDDILGRPQLPGSPWRPSPTFPRPGLPGPTKPFPGGNGPTFDLLHRNEPI